MGLHIGQAVSKFLGLSKTNNASKASSTQPTFNTTADPIGDTVSFSTKADKEVSVADLMSLVDDPEIDMAKLAEYSKKPVATLGQVANVSDANVTDAVKEMVAYTQNPGVGFYTNKAFTDGSATRIGTGAEAFGELMDSGINPEAFYTALQG